ncbi:hypothetical protein CYLTODRAFT_418810 [Cylindrobasidium torrendii FP15055 ss-10]|uniref:Uncharacterized protein n=1 Tax=Cylindrobasidium torrendii FP15055 ss-10 TaxID=1314674 RepID=A0A0D7BLI8_9AGAR|nr:hypothetical protein CYLTODRAFT_418810 [Cylindrobasidium torrendii FP15055 ss-10]
MDRFYNSSSPEFIAYTTLTEHGPTWDSDYAVDEALLGACVAYMALSRYVSGADLFILPRISSEVHTILRRYTYDAIHNMIAKSRSTLQPGGYSRVCQLADQSVRTMLNRNGNASFLLALHSPPSTPAQVHTELEDAPRSIKTQ